MTFLQKLKWPLYQIRLWGRQVFSSGGSTKLTTLTVAHDQDYDAYWELKRKMGAGELSTWQRCRAEIVLSMLQKIPEPIAIGDVGCGDGVIAKYLMNHRPISRAVGYDNSRFILGEAEKLGLETVFFDLNSPSYASEFQMLDIHLFLEVLEHIPHSERALTAAMEHSRRGVIFSVPNTGFFTYRLRLLFGKFPMQWALMPNEHLRFWTIADVKWWLSALGYTDYTICPYFGVPVLNRVWPNLFSAGMVVWVRPSLVPREVSVMGTAN